MAVFFVVFNRKLHSPAPEPEGALPEFGANKLLGEHQTAPKTSGNVEEALVVRMEGTAVADCQRALEHFFPGQVTGTPVVIAENQFKES